MPVPRQYPGGLVFGRWLAGLTSHHRFLLRPPSWEGTKVSGKIQQELKTAMTAALAEEDVLAAHLPRTSVVLKSAPDGTESG